MSDRIDPSPSFRFRVEVDGLLLAAFRECFGIASESEIFEIREGGVNDRTHKRAGHCNYPPITLCRGMTLSLDLWKWRREVIVGAEPYRRTGDIILCDDGGLEILRWTFLDGWPSKWEGPTLLSNHSALAVERIEIVHEGIALAKE